VTRCPMVDSPAIPRRTRIKLWVGNAPKNISARYAPKPLRMNQPKGETRLLETAQPQVEVDVHVALPPGDALDVIGQHLDLAAQAADFLAQFLDLGCQRQHRL